MLDVWLPKSAGPAELERQATIYRDVFTTALAAQKCPAIFLWGFTDRHSWIPGISNGTFDHALIFDRGFRPKPAYEAISSTAAGAPGLPGGPFRRTRPWLKAAGEWRAEGSSLDSALKPGKPPSHRKLEFLIHEGDGFCRFSLTGQDIRPKPDQRLVSALDKYHLLVRYF